MRRGRCYRSRLERSRHVAGSYHELATETRTMTSAKRNNQLQLGDFLILFAIGVTILGGLYTLIA
jgi:hypothetical protein